MRRFFLAVLLLVPAAAFAAAPCKYHAPRNMQINLAGVQAVQIDVHSHNLHLNATDATAPKLIVTGHACSSDNAVMNSLQVTQKLVGNQLLIDIGGDRQAPSNLFGSSYAYLDINMQLPASLPVALRVGSGNATVNGVRQLQSQVNAGDLHVRRVSGKYTASVGAGDIDASDIGKLKTVLQIVSVVAAILAHRWDYWLLFPRWHGGFVLGIHFIAITAIYWMTAVSIISAADYFIGFWKQIDHASERARTSRKNILLNRKAKAAETGSTAG